MARNQDQADTALLFVSLEQRGRGRGRCWGVALSSNQAPERGADRAAAAAWITALISQVDSGCGYCCMAFHSCDSNSSSSSGCDHSHSFWHEACNNLRHSAGVSTVFILASQRRMLSAIYGQTMCIFLNKPPVAATATSTATTTAAAAAAAAATDRLLQTPAQFTC